MLAENLVDMPYSSKPGIVNSMANQPIDSNKKGDNQSPTRSAGNDGSLLCSFSKSEFLHNLLEILCGSYTVAELNNMETDDDYKTHSEDETVSYLIRFSQLSFSQMVKALCWHH